MWVRIQNLNSKQKAGYENKSRHARKNRQTRMSPLTSQCGHQAQEFFPHFRPFPRDFVGTFLGCGLHRRTANPNQNTNTCECKIPPTTLTVFSNLRGKRVCVYILGGFSVNILSLIFVYLTLDCKYTHYTPVIIFVAKLSYTYAIKTNNIDMNNG